MTERWLDFPWQGQRRRALVRGVPGPGARLIGALHGTGGIPRLRVKNRWLRPRSPDLGATGLILEILDRLPLEHR